MYESFAPQFTAGSGVTSVDIKSKNPVKVFGCILGRSATGAPVFTFNDSEGNEIFTITLAGASVIPKSFDIPWIADKGLTVSCDNSVGYFIVFHSEVGT